MSPPRAICPRCRRSYGRPVRVCMVDGAPLVDESRLAAVEAAFHEEEDTGPVVSSSPPPPKAEPPLPQGPFETTGQVRRDITSPRGFGERLGPYRLLRLLGEGGMARIYLAEHEKLGRICAIKRLHADHFTDRLTVARFLAEARAVADITHPNLIAAYDVVEEPNEIYLVMEYLDGRDLAQVIRDEGPLSPARAAEIAAQACDGLAAVHARNIIHRDLKPENIFLTREPDGTERVKLLDFGVARLVGDRPKELKTRSGLTVGTPSYMSPEQATASEIDARSDVYTLGVVLYEMLAGGPPFAGAGYGDVMLMHVNDPPPRLSTRRRDVPPGLEEVVMRCLEKEPEARFQSALELGVALRGGRPSERTQQVVTPRDSRTLKNIKLPPVRSRWLWLGGVGLALIGLTAASTTWLFSPSGNPAPLPEPAVTVAAAGPAAAPGSPQVVIPLAHNVRVSTMPPGADVMVAGEKHGVSPCEVKLPAGQGTVEIEARSSGFFDERRLIDAAAPPPELRLSLRRDPNAPLPRAPAPTERTGRNPRPPRSSRPIDRNGTVDPFSQ